MKQKFFLFRFFFLSFLLLPFSFLLADSIINSVYSVPQLDGNMCFTPEGNFCSLNNTTYEMIAGDIGYTSIPVVPINSTTRAFFSFELLEIPWGYEIDSVIVRLYQFNSIGGPPTQYFPVWNVAGGDTIKCILNHIDYGFELDPDDWEKGDVGNPYTYTNNVGTVTDSEEDGYRYVDVTDCVLFDYQQERTFSQYRIAFQIDTDWDDHHDYVSFTTADATGNFYWPNLFIYLSTDVNIEENEVEFIETFAYVSPNPFNPETTISFSIPEDSKVGITIYNIKGQKVKTLVSEDLEKGIHKIIWDSKDSIGKSVSSGVYFYKLDVNGKTKGLKKMLLLK